MPRISRLLVANRGEIARRIFRTAREMGITTVAVYADSDRDAPFVREAHLGVALGGNSATETYLSIDKLIDAARRSGADAIHPGYGFLSENAAFARAVIAAGLTWVGPHPEAIEAMGDKLAAKSLMDIAGVSTLPGEELSDDAPEALARAGTKVGWPLIVKAAGGGGGRGMRIVRSAGDLAEAVASARREAGSAFGNDTVFLERYLEGARHVEVQVMGDRHGNIVHCFERECSIQRRHQKIIEEAPSPALDAELRERMGAAAVSAARTIHYDNAGTVEFLLDSRGVFFFLEVNTRLQVEHPVTEAITGLDIVREQIRVAEGDALSFSQHSLDIRGCAIEARVYAEDPVNDFLPMTGPVVAWAEPALHGLRIDPGVATGSQVSIHFDPMLAKVIAHAPTRPEAAWKLASALEQLRVHGLTTNRDFLVNVLRHEAFLAGDTTTDFIERFDPPRTRTASAAEVVAAALGAALAAQAIRRAEAPFLPTLPSGWRNNRSTMESVSYILDGSPLAVRYALRRDGSFDYECGEARGVARLASFEPGCPGSVAVEVDGVRHQLSIATSGDQVWMQGAGAEVVLRELPRFPVPEPEKVPGGYSAPMPGKVLQVAVAPGDSVTAGQVLILLEAMKMEHRITCHDAGTVTEVRVAPGQQVERDEIMLVVDTGESA